MKQLISLLVLFSFSQLALATDGSTTIENSDLSAENQIVIANAVQSQCGYLSRLEQIAPTVQIVDYQETGDIYLKVTVGGKKRVDQYIFDDYVVYVDAVVPNYYSSKPILAQVTNVRCELR